LPRFCIAIRTIGRGNPPVVALVLHRDRVTVQYTNIIGLVYVEID